MVCYSDKANALVKEQAHTDVVRHAHFTAVKWNASRPRVQDFFRQLVIHSLLMRVNVMEEFVT